VEDPFKSVLVAGCGNASFSSNLFYDGYLNLVNIDYCDVVIQQQRSKYPEMDWRVMNALSMDGFEDGQFDFIIGINHFLTLLFVMQVVRKRHDCFLLNFIVS